MPVGQKAVNLWNRKIYLNKRGRLQPISSHEESKYEKNFDSYFSIHWPSWLECVIRCQRTNATSKPSSTRYEHDGYTNVLGTARGNEAASAIEHAGAFGGS